MPVDKFHVAVRRVSDRAKALDLKENIETLDPFPMTHLLQIDRTSQGFHLTHRRSRK
jgi:hypothetical protein